MHLKTLYSHPPYFSILQSLVCFKRLQLFFHSSFNTFNMLASVFSTPTPEIKGIPVMSGTPKSLFTFDVVTIKSAGKLEAISEILT